MNNQPQYLELIKTGEIDERINKLFNILQDCVLCSRKCHINRIKGERGYCQAGRELEISSFGPHFGEEEPLVGSQSLVISYLGRVKPVGGSGTIFLTHCSLRCSYCQNYVISHLGEGKTVSPEKFAQIMLELQNAGCYNINLVTPTHYIPQLIKSLKIAEKIGLNLPVVYNCGGYEEVTTIKLLDGLIDIYMPDIKYSSQESAQKYSDAPDYFERCKEAVKEMHRQVGDLKLNDKGIAFQGLLIRHLVLPENLAGSFEVLKFIASEISINSYVNIMDQYRPMFRASQYREINRLPTRQEIGSVMELAKNLGLTRFRRDYFPNT
ncbi:MAG: hypothetical protein DDT40_00322 [candidate division WS2 bacterium]|uniref:Radical SAM core domain-containing protein n=1 Tax=Psychracetigena formicireducens TaxID=2986056 RepID=A0A9E2BGH9_PSYF1|nr:hypothetical protein [Candidatus Psychracetigena formicireducens]MBT9145158.1 hypothetical protein [Candidatus Psychracetigena formicireducens]MBT9150156.1 hypothetical protein [Candidatus Psychracetigena formicireducens]